MIRGASMDSKVPGGISNQRDDGVRVDFKRQQPSFNLFILRMR
jgi:hypothetical protein